MFQCARLAVLNLSSSRDDDSLTPGRVGLQAERRAHIAAPAVFEISHMWGGSLHGSGTDNQEHWPRPTLISQSHLEASRCRFDVDCHAPPFANDGVVFPRNAVAKLNAKSNVVSAERSRRVNRRVQED